MSTFFKQTTDTIDKKQISYNSKDSDRLIQSISMIKDILQSNMQLREEQLSQQKTHEATQQENYQLKIENEDLRDRLMLVTQNTGYEIQYQAYLPVLDLDKMINDCKSHTEIEATKSLILTYIFSLKKENRSLHKRLNDRLYKGMNQTTTSAFDKLTSGQMSEYSRPEDIDDAF